MVRAYIPTLYPANQQEFSTAGYGFLADGISCEVTEEIGNSFELEMRYPVTGVYYDNLIIGNIITCKTNTSTDKRQPFRIYRITKPIDGIVSIYAQHISYDLAGYTVDETNTEHEKDNNATVDTIIAFIQSCANRYVSMIGGLRFTFATDGTFDTARWSISSFTDVRSMMKTAAQTFNGQWEYDGLTCTLHEHRGQDRGVSVDYGKNLQDITEDADMSNTYTHVMPYYKGREDIGEGDERETVDVVVGGLAAAVPTGADIGYKRTIGVDFSSEYNETPTIADLQEKAVKYINVTQLGKIVISRDIKAVDRGQTVEYPGLSGNDIIEIGDEVGINVPMLGISAKMRCMSLTYDAYLDIIKSYEIGDIKKSYISEAAADLADVDDKIDDINDRMDDYDDWIDDIEDTIDDIEEQLHERAPTLFVQEEEPANEEEDPLVNGDYWLQVDKDKNAVAFYKFSSGWGLLCYFKGDFDPLIQAEQPKETTGDIVIGDIWVELNKEPESVGMYLDQVNISDVASILFNDASTGWTKRAYGYNTGSPVANITTQQGDYWFTTDKNGLITILWICTEIIKSGQSFTARWSHVYPDDEAGTGSNIYIYGREPVKVGDYWLKVQDDKNRIAQGLAKWTGSVWEKVVDFYEGGGGVGEYMDTGKTSERFNDYRPHTYDENTQKWVGGNHSDMQYDHIEGQSNKVLNSYGGGFRYSGFNHVEGQGNTLNGTSGDCTHIEGSGNTYTGAGNGYNHVEGYGNTLTGGMQNHVEGLQNTVTGSSRMRVSGQQNSVSGCSDSVVNGASNNVQNVQESAVFGHGHSVRGQQGSPIDHAAVFGTNHIYEGGEKTAAIFGNYGKVDTLGQIFVIGSGSLGNNENCFEVRGSQGVFATGGYNTLGADYAEYFEWADGNTDCEDRCGMLVTLDGDKLIPAHGDDILGAVSAAPSVSGNAYETFWHGKYERDVFGRIRRDDAGKPVISASFDPDAEYIPRSQRPGWAAVGLTGRLVIRDDGSCKVGGFVSARRGVGTSCYKNTGVRVLRRIDERHAEVLIK